MDCFSSTDWARKAGDIYEAARRAPVTITQRSRPTFVLMSYSDYQRKFPDKDTRKSHTLDTIPPDDIAGMEAALDAMERDGKGQK